MILKLVKTLYECVSTNNHNILVRSICKDIKMTCSHEPKSPVLAPKNGPKCHISLITAEKRPKTGQSHI